MIRAVDGNMHTELRVAASPFSRERLTALTWNGIDIRKESPCEERRRDSVQYRTIAYLKNDQGYEVFFDDDGSDEAADVVGVRLDNLNALREITVDLVQCSITARLEPGRAPSCTAPATPRMYPSLTIRTLD
ncbi:hypothetical protein GALL_198020 [mine drainage metagenome]|uniref:Uncharacterized protein n=1 Tax=mine drainage metagenome TaxID=410659 RepID=A0A1J5RPM5_9ZZZZ